MRLVHLPKPTVDGSEILYQLINGKYLIIYRVLYIPGGCLGFLPSTVCTQKDGFSMAMLVYQRLSLLFNRIGTFENTTPFSTLDSVSRAVHVIFHPSTAYLISVRYVVV